MERVHTLINKLQEQLNNNQNATQLLATSQMLVAELSGIELPEQIGKVSVWMPSVYFSVSQQQTGIEPQAKGIEEIQLSTTYLPNLPIPEPIIVELETKIEKQLEPAKEITVLQIDETAVLQELATLESNENFAILNNQADENNTILVDETVNETNEIAIEKITTIDTFIDKKDDVEVLTEIETASPRILLPTVPKEIYTIEMPIENNIEENEEDIAPTLSFQTQIKEQNEVNDMGYNDTKSVNDILKEDKKELAATIVETPIKDLRKAIGINDKYRFINELFQGDENSYERSVKTINGFSVFPEAEHWIKRELHTKLCWVEENESVKQFDQLVRRRFL